MAESRVWFITGASTGFGRILTEYLLEQGDRVVATLRKPEVLSGLVGQYPSSRLVVVKLDVTQHAEISAAFAKAQEAFGRVDVVFNNAGKMINGELESVNDEDAREMFDINFWGAAQVSREAVRFFRDVNQPRGGRLLQVSSGVGISSLACYGHYSATKFALEALTEALAYELDPAWNIKITILQPGPFLTEITTTNRHLAPPHPAYTNPELSGSKWRAIFESGGFVDGDPKKACIAFEKASRLEDPPMRLPLHRRVLDMANEKGKSLIETAEKYRHWSDDLYL
ncbi:NAD(P)-binding protein [Butyriboletus roseoflavus]|nr:NAD(P)-binding protein [Butyriboletus roseoflavus]